MIKGETSKSQELAKVNNPDKHDIIVVETFYRQVQKTLSKNILFDHDVPVKKRF